MVKATKQHYRDNLNSYSAKCLECGLIFFYNYVNSRGPNYGIPYPLPYVWLDGIRVNFCPQCGKDATIINPEILSQ
jgi:hypothetical protein